MEAKHEEMYFTLLGFHKLIIVCKYSLIQNWLVFIIYFIFIVNVSVITKYDITLMLHLRLFIFFITIIIRESLDLFCHLNNLTNILVNICVITLPALLTNLLAKIFKLKLRYDFFL